MNKKATKIFLIESRAARQPYGGVARYIRQMVQGLHARYGPGLAVCSGLKDLPSSIRRVHLPLRYPWRYRSRALYDATFAWENLLVAATENRLKPDVIFSPFYGPLASRTPQVFTVYDLILHLFPQYFPTRGRHLELAHMRRCFLHAAAILCISRSTKSDLLRLYSDLDPEKAHVVPLAVSDAFFHPVPLPKNPRPYFLFVGTRIGYKNFVRLLEAFAVSGLAKDFDLRVISPRGNIQPEWSDLERKTIVSNGLEHAVKLIVGAAEGELSAAYAGATAFVQPSEYEGFGLPILEAMASGTIVACSNISSLPEAGGAAAFYFDPFQVESIAASLREIAELGENERTSRISAGRQHAKSMSWEICVDRTCEILESVARHSNGRDA